MSFGKGSVSFRVFKPLEKISVEDLYKFAAQPAVDLDQVMGSPMTFWAGPGRMSDPDLGKDNCQVGPYLCLNLTTAVRKIPAAMLAEHVAIEEKAEMSARGLPYLNKAARREIKKAVEERLLPQMPLTLTAVQVVVDPQKDRVYATALSGKAVDTLVAAFRTATGYGLRPVAPEGNTGLEFMTWLWYLWETGRVNNVLLEGPLTLVNEGKGVHETVLRKGMPTLSPEATTALREEKLLRKAKLTLVKGDETTSFTLDGLDFTFRGLKLPALAPGAEFVDRLAQVEHFVDDFCERMYGTWLAGPREAEEVKEWIEGRPT